MRGARHSGAEPRSARSGAIFSSGARPSRSAFISGPGGPRSAEDMTSDFLLALAQAITKGLLTGMVYRLMALGLSVIFGVVRVVNFAHGELMTVAMYAAALLFARFELDPFLAVLPVAAAFFVLGYALHAGLINRFITRPEHSQFMLLVAVGLILSAGA